MEQKNIEVELRGFLKNKEYLKLKSFLDKHAKFTKTKDRIIIDYSTCLPGGSIRERTLDIRARITNGNPEIIIKKGSWGGDEARQEISVQLQQGEFLNLLKAYAVMGLDHGILIMRNSLTYQYKGIEFALVEIPNHSFFFEAEIMASDDVSEEIKDTEYIKQVCGELGLTLFSKQEWFAYLDIINKEANDTFDFNKDGIKKMEKILKEHSVS